MKELKKAFNRKMKAASENKAAGHALDALISEKWGFHYSDRDMDWIIDSLDYGHGGLDFKGFVRMMDEESKK